jgi:hypothetical protein
MNLEMEAQARSKKLLAHGIVVPSAARIFIVLLFSTKLCDN